MAWFKRKQPNPQEQVTRAIDKLERSNALIVRLAHLFAFALIIATSVASLISLAATLLIAVLAGHGNVATNASVAITLLLVMAMDTGMVLAATYIRIGRQRGESLRALSGHISIMLSVALLEAGTYCYMLWKYENPSNWISWTLIVARGFAVPLLSIYLSMAQEITVTTSDIARMTEVFSGVGLLRDLVSEANNPDATLERKIAIYRAAATLSEAQRAKLDAMYAAVGNEPMPRIVDADPQPLIVAPVAFTTPPSENAPTVEPLFTSAAPVAPDAPRMRPKKASKRKGATTKKATVARPDERQAAVFKHLDNAPHTSSRELAQVFDYSPASAAADIRTWKAARKAVRTSGPVSKQRKGAPEPTTLPMPW